ncbi:hypothetical protein SAMN05421858_0788 [Haladaptatus litoreus]|uniref:DUF7310 domain-containing protein n=1 Tax=Haladaptatus litoreus TaxID=553468 RepID=A0A1N6WMG6_9EURY|nr:hypothetical protein [Haladaptatus litoreus]SIQ91220.1 hypothetical protein SAMN05421858_0788 [Haladaptatus litoreus]
MSDVETLDTRLRAVERALTEKDSDSVSHEDLNADSHPTITEMTVPELTARVSELESRMNDIEPRLDELDAAVQALRGYVGNIRAVNAEVERRADAALAKAESESNRRESSEYRSTRRESSTIGREPPAEAHTESPPDLPTKRQLSGASETETETGSGSIFARLRGML